MTENIGVQNRAYQVEARDAVLDRWRWQDEPTLLVLPTGTGKTVVAGMIARKVRDDYGLKTLFLAHREELIFQAVDKLSRLDLNCAVEMAGRHARAEFGPPFDVVVGTVQSLQKSRLESWPKNEFGVVIIDEAHHARAKTYGNVLDWFSRYWLLGITATPDRGDRRNLGAIFTSVASEYTLARAIAEEYLVPIKAARLETDVDLDVMGMRGEDYTDAELAQVISPHIETLADAFSQECGARPSVLFTPNVRTAEGMADALTFRGIAARSVSGRMPKLERRDALARFTRGEYQAVVCCDLLTEGWDEPQVSCVGICRPTRLRSRYAQMIGRGTRQYPDGGKRDLLVIDFAWETTNGHELQTVVDLYDDTLDQEVRGVANDLLDRGEVDDPGEAIGQAEEIVAEQRRFRVFLTGRKADYKKVVFDPVGVGNLLGLAPATRRDFDPAWPASAAQIDLLRRRGVKVTDGLSKAGAHRLLNALSRRWAKGMATLKQLQYLTNLHVDPAILPNLTLDEASAMISRLKGGNQ